MTIEGAIGVALVDYISGPTLGVMGGTLLAQARLIMKQLDPGPGG